MCLPLPQTVDPLLRYIVSVEDLHELFFSAFRPIKRGGQEDVSWAASGLSRRHPWAWHLLAGHVRSKYWTHDFVQAVETGLGWLNEHKTCGLGRDKPLSGGYEFVPHVPRTHEHMWHKAGHCFGSIIYWHQFCGNFGNCLGSRFVHFSSDGSTSVLLGQVPEPNRRLGEIR